MVRRKTGGVVEVLEDRRMLALLPGTANPINILASGFTTFASPPVATPSRIFFATGRADTGLELWSSDGTEAGTALVRDINPGAATGNVGNLVAVGANVFFFADDGVHGRELWKSDGTAGGTTLVNDVRPGPASSNPGDLLFSGGKLFFAADDGENGRRLWSAGATGENAHFVADTRGTFATAAAGNNVFCFTDSGVYAVDIASETPTLLIRESVTFNKPIGVFGDKIVFVTVDRGDHPLWISDGTPLGTKIVSQDVGLPSGFRYHFTQVGNLLYFVGQSAATGDELWKSDGTPENTGIVRDIRSGPASSIVSVYTNTPFGVLGGNIYFPASDTGRVVELWTSDGTTAGTHRVSQTPGELDLQPQFFTTVNARLYFSTYGGIGVSDGTDSGTVSLPYRNIGSNIPVLWRGSLYVSASNIYRLEASDLAPPNVKSFSFYDQYRSGNRLTIQFTEMVRASVDPADFQIQNLDTGEVIVAGTATVETDVYFETLATLNFPNLRNGVLPDGNFRLTVLPGGIRDAFGNALNQPVTYDNYMLNGDLDRNRSVDLHDFLLFNFGLAYHSAVYDLNGDHLFDIRDFAVFASQFGKSVPPLAAAVATNTELPAGELATLPRVLERTYAAVFSDRDAGHLISADEIVA